MTLGTKDLPYRVCPLSYHATKNDPAMPHARPTIHLPITVALLLALALPVAASEMDDARAAYVASLVDSMHKQVTLTQIEAAVTMAEGDLADTLAAQEQALAAALVGPRAVLLAAKADASDLAALAIPVPPRIAVLTAEVTRLESQQEAAISAAADRLEAIADLQAQLSAAVGRQQSTATVLAAAQAELAAAEATWQDFAQLKALGTTAVDLRDPQLRDYVWATFVPQDLVNATRDAFLSTAVELAFKGEGTQVGLSWGWTFDDVPQGDAWLLWDNRTDAPLDLIERRDDIFEQPVFLRVPVAKDTVVDAADLQRVDINDVEESVWPSRGGSAYDVCLDRLAPANEDGAIRQLCQTLFAADARYDVSVRYSADRDIVTAALLLSGAEARAFAALYRTHLAALRELASGDVPVQLLPLVQQKIKQQGDQLSLQVAEATRRLASAEMEASAADADLSRRQQAQLEAVAANAAASSEDEEIATAIAAQLTALQEELAALKAEHDREVAVLVTRKVAAAEAVRAAEQAVAAVRAGVEQDWVAPRQRSNHALAFAKEAFDLAQKENDALQQAAETGRNRFLAMLASSKILQRVYFDLNGVPSICMNVQNGSDHYALLQLVGLRFRDQPFTQIALLSESGNGDYIFRNFKNGVTQSFENKYSESVRGLAPGQIAESCSYMNDPEAGELGRYFDSIGGFSVSDWGVDLDVQFGTFVDTGNAITIVSTDIVFADDLTAAKTDASAAYRSEQKPLVSSGASISATDTPEAAAEPAQEGATPAAGELTAHDPAETGALAEPDSPTITDAVADEVLDLDRVLGREVQAALNTAGFAVGQPDGLIGARSRKAIADWQASHGHAATGALTRGQAADLLGHVVP